MLTTESRWNTPYMSPWILWNNDFCGVLNLGLVTQLTPKKTMNKWADFWRYHIGVNVIPADTRNKKPLVPWLSYQDKPISEWQHSLWKDKEEFNNGIAIILGKVWHNLHKIGLYLIGFDLDNQKAIEEIFCRDGKNISLSQLAKRTLIEHILPLDEIKSLALQWNKNHCNPPVMRLWISSEALQNE